LNSIRDKETATVSATPKPKILKLKLKKGDSTNYRIESEGDESVQELPDLETAATEKSDSENDVRLKWAREDAKMCEEFEVKKKRKKSNKKSKKQKKQKKEKSTKVLIRENEEMKNQLLQYLLKKKGMGKDDPSSSDTESESDSD